MDPQTAHGLLILAEILGICLGFAALFIGPAAFYQWRRVKRERAELPDIANWRVKGDGVAYTTSTEILNSKAGRKLIEDASKIRVREDSRPASLM